MKNQYCKSFAAVVGAGIYRTIVCLSQLIAIGSL